jgi:V/A-type H+-transporting ATPase subunit I
MTWRDRLQPVRMQRVAVVAPAATLRDALVQVADAGTVELGAIETEPPQRDAPAALLARTRPDLEACQAAGRRDLLAGEAELERHATQARVQGLAAGLAGWMPSSELPDLRGRLATAGAAVVPLPTPPGTDPPTLLVPGGLGGSFAPLVKTYASVPYADVDPSAWAGIAYVVMFGMMFADADHGVLLLLAALVLRSGRIPRLARLRAAWPFLAGAGAASAVVGLAYGEFFGPTGAVPTLWREPLEHPVALLQVAVGVGALLLAGAYALGSTNRWREGGWPTALYAASGIAGSALFVGLGLVGGGWYRDRSVLVLAGALTSTAGVVLAYIGLLAGAGGGGAGAVQAGVELFDVVIRIGANLISFARLAAFGLTHAAIGKIVWDGTTGLWGRGVLLSLGALCVFVVGNVISFALEALVAAVQALRLAYYELFSRVFSAEGRPFQPWHVPITSEEVAP